MLVITIQRIYKRSNVHRKSALKMLILSTGGLQILQILPNAHSLNRERPFAEQLLRQLSLLIYVILLVFTVFYHKFVYYCTEMIL